MHSNFKTCFILVESKRILASFCLCQAIVWLINFLIGQNVWILEVRDDFGFPGWHDWSRVCIKLLDLFIYMQDRTSPFSLANFFNPEHLKCAHWKQDSQHHHHEMWCMCFRRRMRHAAVLVLSSALPAKCSCWSTFQSTECMHCCLCMQPSSSSAGLSPDWLNTG